jgi:hypothetical protein
LDRPDGYPRASVVAGRGLWIYYEFSAPADGGYPGP